jgi:integrase
MAKSAGGDMATGKKIAKAVKVALTAGRIAALACPKDKSRTYLWCAEVKGLGVLATVNGAKSFIFQAKVNTKSMRLTIGDVSIWGIAAAQAEARRLQTVIDQGNDPRQVKAEQIAVKEADVAALKQKQLSETVTVAEAWKAYVTDRSTAFEKGKKVWGDRYKIDHDKFASPGGVKRTRGRRPGEPETTRPGVLFRFMKMRLADLDAKAVKAWLAKEVALAPTDTAKAFRALRAFIGWCAKHEAYSAAVHADACQADEVKKQVPTPNTKPNDSLRKAQIKPWFEAVRKIGNPVISAYLQVLLLTGARRNELATLSWDNVDFKWKSLTIRDKITKATKSTKAERTIPLPPYMESLIASLPRRNKFVFSSPTSASGNLEEPRIAHNQALASAGLPPLSIHGLRRSFGTLSEWVEVPAGICAQIEGRKPSGVREKHYIQRELDLLHLWHVKIEAWILEQAGIQFVPVQAGLHVVHVVK